MTPTMIDMFETNNDEKISSEMVKVTIALAEYRSLVAENQRLECEVDRLRFECDRAIKDKEDIRQQWINEKEWWKKQNDR